MKLNRLGLNLVAAAVLTCLAGLTSVSSAQNANTNTTNTTNTTNRAGRRGPSVEQRVDRMATELNLNNDQKVKLTALFQKEGKERREIFNLPREERRDKMRALMEEQKKELAVILTPDQLEKWKTLRQQMRANRPRRPGQSGEAAPAPAPAPTPNGAAKQAQ